MCPAELEVPSHAGVCDEWFQTSDSVRHRRFRICLSTPPRHHLGGGFELQPLDKACDLSSRRPRHGGREHGQGSRTENQPVQRRRACDNGRFPLGSVLGCARSRARTRKPYGSPREVSRFARPSQERRGPRSPRGAWLGGPIRGGLATLLGGRAFGVVLYPPACTAVHVQQEKSTTRLADT